MAQWYFKDGGNICQAKQQSVKVLKIGEILSQELSTNKPLRIPLYQRRYCWNDSAIQKLFEDVKEQINKKFPHRFNRMILSEQNDHIMVVDGQQRLTSFCLFLAAIRDVFSNEMPSLGHEINNILFPHGVPETLNSFSDINFVVSPTYLDRPLFYQVLFPYNFSSNSRTTIKNSSTTRSFENSRASRAYQIFIQLLCIEKENHGSNFGRAITNALLTNCSALYFSIYDENVWEVFERMGGHTYYFERNSMGIDLAETDFIRNCILSQFQSEEKQIDIFTNFWLPLEKQACTGSDVTSNFNQLFRDFLTSIENKNEEELGLREKFGVYNLIRPRLVGKNEEVVQMFLEDLFSFSQKWFASRTKTAKLNSISI